jgi:hypothetical protein
MIDFELPTYNYSCILQKNFVYVFRVLSYRTYANFFYTYCYLATVTMLLALTYLFSDWVTTSGTILNCLSCLVFPKRYAVEITFICE